MNVRKYNRNCEWCKDNFMAAHPSARYCSGNCRKRAGDDRARGTCTDCGAALCAGSLYRGSLLCGDCSHAKETRVADERAKEFVQLWHEGKTLRQIAQHFGWPDLHIAGAWCQKYRERGYDLPYRRTGQALVNIRAANNGWAAARAGRQVA